MKTSKEWTGFCDGASSGNPGPGGWAFLFLEGSAGDSFVQEDAGFVDQTTNNRMELLACVKLFDFLTLFSKKAEQPNKMTLYSDSRYLVVGSTYWISKWKKKGWVSEEGKEILHQDLWEKIDSFLMKSLFPIEFRHVDGHSGNQGNDRVDFLAVEARKQKRTPDIVYSGPYSTFSRKIDLEFPSRSAKEMRDQKRSSEKKSSENSYYISDVDGVIEHHKDWKSCEARVKGRSGARFKKVANAQEESTFLANLSKNKNG